MHPVEDLRQVSLADLSLSDASPVELIEAAAAAGFGAVGLLLRSGTGKPIRHEIAGHPQVIREIKAACAANAMRVFDVECFVLSRGISIEDEYLPLLELGAELGATHISCIGSEFSGKSDPLPDSLRLDMFGRLCDAAARFGLRVGVEFMLYREIHTMGEALRMIRDSGRQNCGLIVDALHLSRSGGHPADLAEVPRELISYVQLCDAHATAPGVKGLPREARTDRLHLGTGSLPLADLLGVLPDATPLAVEVPVLGEARLRPHERALEIARATRGFLDRVVA